MKSLSWILLNDQYPPALAAQFAIGAKEEAPAWERRGRRTEEPRVMSGVGVWSVPFVMSEDRLAPWVPRALWASRLLWGRLLMKRYLYY